MKHAASLARNILSNWVVFAASLLYGLFITPLVIEALGQELYGVWAFLNGLLSYTELLYLGLGSAIVKSVSQFRAAAEVHRIVRLTSVVTAVYVTLGIGCFGLFLLLSPWVPLVLAQPLSEGSGQIASITFAILGAQVMFVFFGSAFGGVVSGHERYDLVSAVSLAGIVARVTLITVFVPRSQSPMLLLASITVATTALQSMLLAVIAFRLVPQLSIRPVRPKAAELGHLYRFGLQVFLITFASKLISYTDTTVIGVTLGASSVALYAVPAALLQYSGSCVAGFTRVFLPRATVLAARGDHVAIRAEYLRTVRIAIFIVGWLAAGLISLGPMFIRRWIGPEFGEPVQWVIVWLSVAAIAQALTSQAALPYYQAMGLLRVPAVTLLVEALANLGLSVWLAPRIGITGVALATALPALFISLLVLPSYLCRQLAVPLSSLAARGIFPGLLMAVTSLASLLFLRASVAGSYLGIAALALSTLPCAVLVFWLTFPHDEQLRVRRSLGRLRPRGSA